MKKYLLLSAAIGVLAFTSGKATFADTVPVTPDCTPTITVTSPNGRETYNAGDAVLVTWTSCGITSDNVTIGLTFPSAWISDGTGIAAISAPNTGSYTMTLPPPSQFSASGGFLQPGAYYGITISADSASDSSDAVFTINNPIVVSTSFVGTSPASDIAPDSAVLNGGLLADAWASGPFPIQTGFMFRPLSIGSITTDYPVNAAAVVGPFSITATGLACNTAYAYYAYGKSGDVTITGSPVIFTTSPCASTPNVVTDPVTDITADSAVLHGTFLSTLWQGSRSGSFPVQASFAVSSLAGIGGTVYHQVTTLTAPGSFSYDLTGLDCHTIYQIQAAGSFSEYEVGGEPVIFTTTDCPSSGFLWAQQTATYESHSLHGVAMSANGKKIIATDSFNNGEGSILTSVNGGVTWTIHADAGDRSWGSVASSSDGMALAATIDGGYIYTSIDGGHTWTEQTAAGIRRWISIASSSDGMKLAAIVDNGYIYTSADGGATWTEQTGSDVHTWSSIASSADGTKLAATAYGIASETIDPSVVYISTDGGVTWTPSLGGNIFGSLTMSGDGTKLAVINTFATSYGVGYIHVSTDGGATWTTLTSSGLRPWTSVAYSADGSMLVAVDHGTIINGDTIFGGYIYTSTDDGLTWTPQTSAGINAWGLVAVSADGSKMIARTVNGNSVWIRPSAPSVAVTSVTVNADNTVTAEGTVVDTGGAGYVTYGFEYGLTDSFGSMASGTLSSTPEAFTADITGLHCDATYHIRAYATNLVGTGTAASTFTTNPCDTTTSGGGGDGGGAAGAALACGLGKVDTNHDCKVDVIDFVPLMANWNKTGRDNIADFNQDGTVGMFDFVMLMADWTK